MARFHRPREAANRTPEADRELSQLAACGGTGAASENFNAELLALRCGLGQTAVRERKRRVVFSQRAASPCGPCWKLALWFIILFVAALVLLSKTTFAQAPAKALPGLVVTYTADDKTDIASTPNVWLFLPGGAAPTPFLPSGKFTAVWAGFINADLRGDFQFRAEVSGSVKLELNGVAVLEVVGDGKAPSAASKPVRLNKGANALKATFTNPASGDALIRLHWSEKGMLWEPIPLTTLTRSPDQAALAKADQLRQGRELFFEHRCVKCHTGPAAVQGAPELAMDAPGFDGIGGRRNFAWMALWILDPKAQRASAHMPKLLRGSTAEKDAESMAAYLASLKSAEKGGESVKAPAEAGKVLAANLNCAGCHNFPDAKETAAKKISLAHINFKFPPASLVAFIRNPGAHYAWTRMPKFKLGDEEAAQLAAYLSSNAPVAKQPGAPTDAAVLERGQKLVQTTGCLNCHSLKLDNQFKTKSLAELKPERFQSGCLLESLVASTGAPTFVFTKEESAALQLFLATDRASLTRHAPVEFVERQTRLLNCNACHGQLEGFPALPLIGGKLKPEWMRQFIAGEVGDKPRPWVVAQMPAFPQSAETLATGLAMSHGYPAQTAVEPPAPPEMVKIGRKFVGADGGFSCISCHAVGDQKATQVFESEGINLSRSASRLQKDYFARWLMNPLRVEPTTKMPVYFDEETGKSQLTDILEGSGAKQIDAIWQYLRQGDQIQPPGAP